MKNLIRVLWDPLSVFEQLRGGAAVAPAALMTMIVDLLLSLALLTYISGEFDRLAAMSGGNIAGLRPVFLGFAILGGTFTNVLAAVVAAFLLYLAVAVAGGNTMYRNLFGLLALGSVPALIGRVLRVGAYVAGLSADPMLSLTNLSGLFRHAEGSEWYRVLQTIDLFDIWSFALILWGSSRVAGLSRERSVLLTGLVWGGIQFFLIRMSLAGGGVPQ